MADTTSEANRKGRLLEDVVELLYQVPGVEVRKRVRLSPPTGGRNREIDLLITADTPLYPVKFYAECKNEKSKVGASKVESFVTKLIYLGVSAHSGIYISPTGFTEGALEVAGAFGIRTLVLSGLTADRLEAELFDAVQSHVLYLGFVRQVACDVPVVPSNALLRDMTFFDDDGQITGNPQSLLWKAWYFDETIPLVVGDYDIEPPSGYHAVWNGNTYPVTSFKATLGVKAFTFHLPGSAKHVELRHADDGSLDRQKTEIEFPEAAGYFPLQGFDSQNELLTHLAGLGRYHVLFLVRLPRIQWGQVFWPLSARVEDLLAALPAESPVDWNEQFSSLTQGDLEGGNLSTVFEPVLLDDTLWHPTAKVAVGRVVARRRDGRRVPGNQE